MGKENKRVIEAVKKFLVDVWRARGHDTNMNGNGRMVLWDHTYGV